MRDPYHLHFEANPEANPDEPVSGVMVDGNPVSIFYVSGNGDSAAVTFNPLLKGHLNRSGWVRVGSDDVALLRIAKALEAIAARPLPDKEVTDTVPLAKEVISIEERRQRRGEDT